MSNEALPVPPARADSRPLPPPPAPARADSRPLPPPDVGRGLPEADSDEEVQTRLHSMESSFAAPSSDHQQGGGLSPGGPMGGTSMYEHPKQGGVYPQGGYSPGPGGGGGYSPGPGGGQYPQGGNSPGGPGMYPQGGWNGGGSFDPNNPPAGYGGGGAGQSSRAHSPPARLIAVPAAVPSSQQRPAPP